MKKRDLITMFLCVPGAGLFALGMCMCLLPEWGAAVQGVWTGAAGIAVLLWAWGVASYYVRQAGRAAFQWA